MDPIAVGGLVAGIVAAIAGVFAAIYSALAPSRKDLRRVEKNTEDTAKKLEEVHDRISSVDSQLREQAIQEQVKQAAGRIQISARGDQEYGGPLRISFTVSIPTVKLLYVELLNEAGALFGTVNCVATERQTFACDVEPIVAQRWFSGGAVEGMVSRMRLVIRAVLLLEERRVDREFAVHLVSELKQVPGTMTYLLSLDGKC
jgi:hypothetical protein